VSVILLETNKGIIFEKTETKNRCRVAVRDKEHGAMIMDYRFKKIDKTYNSPYISWDNLNCCGGWSFDESYLLTAVQKGKKLCAGITFYDESELNGYISDLPDNLEHFCHKPDQRHTCCIYNIDVVANGSLKDYYSFQDICDMYDNLGISANFNKRLLKDLFDVPLYYFINDETFEYANAVKSEELIVTGLMLGYPIESTAWLIERDCLPPTQYPV